MTSSLLHNIFIGLLFAFLFSSISIAENNEAMYWKAGVAKAVITPEKPVWLAGYGWKREPTGVIHDIWVKALALEDNKGYRSVIVTSDLMGIPKYMYENIYRKVNKRLHLERSQFMLTFSHNHSAPRLNENLVDYYPVDSAQVKIVKEYSDEVEVKIFETVLKAFSNLAPAKLAYSKGETDFAVNRRNNLESDVPKHLKTGVPLKGPVDHSVPVMTVQNSENKLIAVLFGYACHPTVLRFNEYCGDYPGFALIALEKNHPGMTAMFFTGAGGDQNPLPRKKVSLCIKYGNMLAEAVEKTLKSSFKPIPPGLRTAFEFVDLDYLDKPTRKELEEAATKLDDEDVTVVRCIFDGPQLIYSEQGNTLSLNIKYGLVEPSLVKYNNQYYLTMRNNLKGYVSISNDGLNYSPIKEWKFDDGIELGSYNTQQHWLVHSDGMFLIYTRRGANNDNVKRHRAPLFIAQVDTCKLCVIRETEKVVIPQHGVPMGNFGAAAINENESWVTVSEFMWPDWNEKARKLGAAGNTFVARVIWR